MPELPIGWLHGFAIKKMAQHNRTTENNYVVFVFHRFYAQSLWHGPQKKNREKSFAVKLLNYKIALKVAAPTTTTTAMTTATPTSL